MASIHEVPPVERRIEPEISGFLHIQLFENNYVKGEFDSDTLNIKGEQRRPLATSVEIGWDYTGFMTGSILLGGRLSLDGSEIKFWRDKKGHRVQVAGRCWPITKPDADAEQKRVIRNGSLAGFIENLRSTVAKQRRVDPLSTYEETFLHYLYLMANGLKAYHPR